MYLWGVNCVTRMRMVGNLSYIYSIINLIFLEMKTIVKLKLSQINKDSVESRQMSQIMGGTFCYYGPGSDNQKANDNEGKCSCECMGINYYSSDGLNLEASFLKSL